MKGPQSMHCKQFFSDYIKPHVSKTSCVLQSPTANFHSVISLNISLTEHLPVFLVHRCAHKRIESGRKITLFISYHVMKPFQHMKLHLIRIILDFFLPLG